MNRQDQVPTAKNKLSDIDMRHVAFCKKGAVPDAVYAIVKSEAAPQGAEVIGAIATIAKIDTVKKQVFGYVLVPDKADHQGDVVTKEDIEEARNSFMKNLAHATADGTGASDSHVTIGGGYPIEVAVDKDGSIAKAADAPPSPGGLWVGMQVTSDPVWKKIEKGEYTAFSLGGFGKRTPIGKKADAELADESNQGSIIRALKAGFDKLVEVVKGDGDALSYDEAGELKDLRRQFWDKNYQLEESIQSIMGDDEVEDKVTAITESIDQFKGDIVSLVTRMEAIKNKQKESTEKSNTPMEGDVMTKEQMEELQKSLKDGFKDTVTEVVKSEVGEKLNKIDEIDTRLTAMEKKLNGEDGEDPIETMSKDITTAIEGLNGLQKRLTTLEITPTGPNGDREPGTQTEPTDVNKNETTEQRDERLAKGFIHSAVNGAVATAKE